MMSSIKPLVTQLNIIPPDSQNRDCCHRRKIILPISKCKQDTSQQLQEKGKSKGTKEKLKFSVIV